MTYPKNVKDFLSLIKYEDIKFIDVKLCDAFGQWHHLTYPAARFTTEYFSRGIPFDGSSMPWWRDIKESDMILIPDPTTAFVDPFFEEKTLSVICDAAHPGSKRGYVRDARVIARKALKVLKKTKVADMAYMGSEVEFFIFDKLTFINTPNQVGYEIDSTEGWWNTTKSKSEGRAGNEIPYWEGCYPVSPLDKTGQLRLEMAETLEKIGLTVEKAHHEGGTAGQSEIDFRYDNLLKSADNVMKYQYVLKNVGQLHQKHVSFMPKPMANECGSGMHCHFSLWKKGKNLFAGRGASGISRTALYAIGGILEHGRALTAFTNPSTNSYHRLIPGYHAPVYLTYSAKNRSAAIRIPSEDQPEARRIELRFPDPSANPYLAFTAILMAAIDGIKRKISPGRPFDRDTYRLTAEEKRRYTALPKSLSGALHALRDDSKFLQRGNVFSKDFLNLWIMEKEEEIETIQKIPHPKEFELYYYL
ncbi:MAG TPA: type I glutamate--ammonia ligase [Patescibacteria group bacterium]